jgi:hypothetical protein
MCSPTVSLRYAEQINKLKKIVKTHNNHVAKMREFRITLLFIGFRAKCSVFRFITLCSFRRNFRHAL